MPDPVIALDPLLSDSEADAVLEAWKAFPEYGQYSNEGFDTLYAPELAQRYDAIVNFIQTGGRFGRKNEGLDRLLARTNYFRDTYVYGDEVFAGDLAFLMHHPRLVEAARALHDRPVIEPSILYANVMVPGQELAVHTDVPEFRGANRMVLPQWLIVVMHHSGLFQGWRMPIATAICYFGGGTGGELAYYPAGADGPAATYTPGHNRAAMLDTDSIFHGVDRVGGDESRLDAIKPGMTIRHESHDTWSVRNGGVATEYRTDELRLSISWKAYCFRDDAERRAWAEHSDDLDLDAILGRLEEDLRTRAVLYADRPEPAEFGKLLIDTYVRFPEPADDPGAS